MNWIYIHDLDPFLVRFTQTLGVRWYGLAYVIGFLIGYGLLLWQTRRGWLDLSRSRAGDFVITVALWGVVGGRVGYVLLYNFAYFLESPLYLFKVWEGGMSIHGGVVGAVAGMVFFSRRVNASFPQLTDAAAMGTPPGLMLGRIANFINGELWGRATGGSWGVKFPQEIYTWGPDKLDRLRQILLEQDLISRNQLLLTQQQIAYVVQKIRSGNQAMLDAVGPLLPPRHPSQLYESLAEGPILFLILWWIRENVSRPGRVGASFLIGYGVVRFLVEYTRAPDPHIGYEFLGMTRGQEYSLLFVALGLGYWAWLRYRTEEI